MSEFSGSVAIVAGGALGIGRAAAQRLAQDDASVVICSDQNDQVEQAVDELRSKDLEVQGLRADVTSSADMERLVAFTADAYGGVDILVNSAGVQRYGTVVQTEEEVWDEVLDVNLKGIYLASKHAIPEMRKREGGAIVNLSSVQAFASQKGGGGLHGQQGRDQRPDPRDGPRSRGGEHPGERGLPGLGGDADAQVVGQPVQGREKRR